MSNFPVQDEFSTLLTGLHVHSWVLQNNARAERRYLSNVIICALKCWQIRNPHNYNLNIWSLTEENVCPGKYHSVVKTIPSCPKSLLTFIECFGVPWLSLHPAGAKLLSHNVQRTHFSELKGLWSSSLYSVTAYSRRSHFFPCGIGIGFFFCWDSFLQGLNKQTHSKDKHYHFPSEILFFLFWRESTGPPGYPFLTLPIFTSILPIVWLHAFPAKALQRQKIGSYLSIKAV